MKRFVPSAILCVLGAACGGSSSPGAPSAPPRSSVAVGGSAPAGFGTLGAPVVASAGGAAFARCLNAEPQPECAAAPAAVATSSIAPPPGAPINLTATVTGTTVVLTWTAPAAAAGATAVLEYVLEAGSGAGLANLVPGQGTGGTAAIFTAPGVAAGTYFVRVRARDAAGALGPASNEITVVVNSTSIIFNPPAVLGPGRVGRAFVYNFCDPAPGAGFCQGGGALGPRGGVAPYHFQLGSGVGFPPAGLSLDVNGVLAGTPTAATPLGGARFSVVAIDLGGNSGFRAPTFVAPAPPTSPAQAAATITMTVEPACTTPAAPAGFTSTVSGSTITLRWSAVTDATSYVLQAGSSAGSTNLANSDIGNVTSYTATGIGNGTYYIRIRAKNACGDLSAASTESTTVVGPVTTGGITGFFGRGGCQYFEIFDFWTGCKADVTANITKIVTSGNLGVLLFWNTGGGDGLFHGDLRVTPGTAPGNVTISTTSGSLFRRYCTNAIPVTIEIFDGTSGTGGVGIPLLYSLNSTWTGFGCG